MRAIRDKNFHSNFVKMQGEVPDSLIEGSFLNIW